MKEQLKILVVDRDGANHQKLDCAFQLAGVETQIERASNLTAAIATLNEIACDCVFFDNCLPPEEVAALVEQLKTSKLKVPAIALVDPESESNIRELRNAGVSDYVLKPYLSPELLMWTVENTLRIDRAEKETAKAYQQILENYEALAQKNQKLEEQRQQIHVQNLELIEAAQLKSKFLATVSHELRTPLNAILGFIQIVRRQTQGILTSAQSEMVERIYKNAKHLLALIEDILDLSQLETHRLELNREHFDIAQVIAATAEKLRPLAEQKGLALQVRSRLHNALVTHDRARIQQILENLLSNAIKFTETGVVEVEASELSPNRLAISVRDTGIGMTSDHLKYVFEPFRQVNQTNSRKYGGTGLGLAIVSALVKLFQGKIIVQSQLGVGSVFQVELPRQLSSSISPKPSTPAPKHKQAIGTKMRSQPQMFPVALYQLPIWWACNNILPLLQQTAW